MNRISHQSRAQVRVEDSDWGGSVDLPCGAVGNKVRSVELYFESTAQVLVIGKGTAEAEAVFRKAAPYSCDVASTLAFASQSTASLQCEWTASKVVITPV